MRFIDVSGALSPMILNANAALITLPLQLSLYRSFNPMGTRSQTGALRPLFFYKEKRNEQFIQKQFSKNPQPADAG